MASLKFIIDADDDTQDAPPSRSNKKGKEPPAPSGPGGRGHQEASSSTSTTSTTRSGHAHSNANTNATSYTNRDRDRDRDHPSSASIERHLSTSSSASALPASAPGKRRQPSKASTSSSTAPSRRRSTTSTDSMDQTGYASSSSMGEATRGGYAPPNHPIRPMPPSNAGSELPLKLTPITGRVSRAKKGVPVHTCEQCKPPKTFTRAEHLRRHQLSHQVAGYPCNYAGCERAFHRPDLLARHQQKHDLEGDSASASRSGGSGSGRRGSSSSIVEGTSRMGLQQPVMSTAGGPAPGSLGASTPVTNPDVSATPNASPSQQRTAPTASSPNMGGRANYAAGAGQYSGYVDDRSRPTIIYPASSHHGADYGVNVPRTPGPAPFPLFVVTQGLSSIPQPVDSNPPELSHVDASPWASSTDSSYSTTPATEHVRNQRYAGGWGVPPGSPGEWSSQQGTFYPNPPAATAATAATLDNLAQPYFYSAAAMPHLAPPHHHQGGLGGGFLDVPMTGGFHDTSSMLAGPSQHHGHAHQHQQHGHHHHHTSSNVSSSVRSPSPILTTSTSSAETLVTPSPALPADRIGLLLGRHKELGIAAAADVSVGMAYGGGLPFGGGSGSPGSVLAATSQQGGFGGGGGGIGPGHCGAGGGVAMAAPLANTVRKAIPAYLDVYWAHFHPRYPIVHRGSFEAAAGRGTGEDVLRCAMAAAATQFLDGKEDRIRGNQLHEYAWQEAKRCPQWNLQVLQAILICEFFARFRGRKAVVKPSKAFENVYSRVLDFTNAAAEAGTAAALAEAQQQQQQANQERWHNWVDTESRRRLLAACFFVDVHTSIYHEQARVRHFDLLADGTLPIPLIGTSTPLWDAPSADAWAALPPALHTAPAPSPDWATLTPDQASSLHPFDRAIILAAEATRLPRRAVLRGSQHHSQTIPPSDHHPSSSTSIPSSSTIPAPSSSPDPETNLRRAFPTDPVANTYLALHHTPLLDLLAVSGDSWVFSHKVLPADSFLEHQKRLKAWADAHTRRGGVTAGVNAGGAMSAARATVYAARALCAFLERGPRRDGEGENEGGKAGAGWMGDLSEYWAAYVCGLIIWAFGHRPARGGGSGSQQQQQGAGDSDEEVAAWLASVADMSDEEVVRVRGRREAASVVALVRRQLDLECVGGRNRLFVDAVAVLKKLEEGVNWKWF